MTGLLASGFGMSTSMENTEVETEEGSAGEIGEYLEDKGESSLLLRSSASSSASTSSSEDASLLFFEATLSASARFSLVVFPLGGESSKYGLKSVVLTPPPPLVGVACILISGLTSVTGAEAGGSD